MLNFPNILAVAENLPYGRLFLRRKADKGRVTKYLLQGAEHIGRGHQTFLLLVNGPQKMFADS